MSCGGEVGALLVDLRLGADHDAGDAEAALQSAHRRERARVAVALVLGDAFEGHDRLARRPCQRHLARHHGLAVDEHRAATALTRRRAAVLRRRDVELFAQRRQQVRMVGAHPRLVAVDDERHHRVVHSVRSLSLIDDLRWCDDAALCGDYRVVLDLAVASEVEQCAFVSLTPIEITGCGDHFVGGREGLRDDLPRRRHDHRLRERIDAFFDTALGRRRRPTCRSGTRPLA